MGKLGNAAAKFLGLEAAVQMQQLLASPPAWADSSHLSLIGELYGIADSSGIVVNRRTALGLPIVAKGRRLLATNIARMQLVNRKGAAPAPMQLAYLQQPEADRSLSATLTWTVDALYFYPRTWWIVQKRDAAGWPARGGVKLLDRKDAEFDKDGRLVGAWGKPVAARDVIQFDAPDGGLLHDGQTLLRRAFILNRAVSLAEENPVPSVNLENTGNEALLGTQIVELLESWMEARRRYGVGYTDKSIKATTLGISNSQLLIDGQKQMDVNLARQVGLPAWAADVAVEGASLNYSNRSSRAWELIDLFLSTYMTPITSRLSMNDTTPIGWSTAFSTDDLTRDDIKTRFETYAIGIEKNFIDQTWIEAQEGQQLKGIA
ncbi:hypothetical protein [Microbacterium allomyrinae]|uniref:Phage portal protein n=1 Tax=Microbacterium allomyrinae TaxID=2830666 RepID=A0A9X1S570_9MICO|nr:hypothetical protein [Microbacterium allomyrinae]MCC2034212.1 hypothetical protein [Microbacterium allomyrinae]